MKLLLVVCAALYWCGQAFAQDFGDDTSSFANDGECDDPRFEGPGVASYLSDVDLGHDATDCQNLLAQGRITWRADILTDAAKPANSAAAASTTPRSREPTPSTQGPQALGSGVGSCEIPGYPDKVSAFHPATWGVAWCPSSVGMQVRSFAMQAALQKCALVHPDADQMTAKQVTEVQRRIKDLCNRLDTVRQRLGGGKCKCPAGYSGN